MKHLFISYEIAKQLKYKGFDEYCFRYYHLNFPEYGIMEYCQIGEFENMIPAPLYQQVIDWLREKHNLHITLKHYATSQTYGFVISGMYKGLVESNVLDCTYNNYYEALNKAIEEALKLI